VALIWAWAADEEAGAGAVDGEVDGVVDGEAGGAAVEEVEEMEVEVEVDVAAPAVPGPMTGAASTATVARATTVRPDRPHPTRLAWIRPRRRPPPMGRRRDGRRSVDPSARTEATFDTLFSLPLG
jgi:hypothetical protein